MASGTIKEQQNVIDKAYTGVLVSPNVAYTSITAVEKPGYTFLFWVATHTYGWSEGFYFEDPSAATTHIWRNNGASSPSIDKGGSVYAMALYRKN